MKLRRDQHVTVVTTDNDFVFNSPDFEVVLENMFVNDFGNISCGEVCDFMRQVSTVPKEERKNLLRDVLLSYVKNDEEFETEFEADLLVSYFESKDTYWDVEKAERKELMKKNKET